MTVAAFRAPQRVRWPGVTLQPGRNRIEVQAKAGDKTLRDVCEWDLQPNP